jgi:hypothetical protein
MAARDEAEELTNPWAAFDPMGRLWARQLVDVAVTHLLDTETAVLFGRAPEDGEAMARIRAANEVVDILRFEAEHLLIEAIRSAHQNHTLAEIGSRLDMTGQAVGKRLAAWDRNTAE